MRQSITYSLLLVAIITSLTCITGCKGAGGKKAATEALEFIEKKAGSKAASTIEREAAQTERAAVREAETYTPSRTSSRPHRPHHSYDNDDEYEPQVYSVQCAQCGGAGAVYVLDYYGNIQYDYYGNPLISQCPYCNGTGAVLVSQ